MSPNNPDDDYERLSEPELWSWVDRDDPRLEAYLAAVPEDRAEVERLRSAIKGVQASDRTAWPERIGEYQIEGVLGRGGMGVVLAARQAFPARRVALKVLPQEWANDARWLKRMRREADVLARLDHPGIATVIGAGTDRGSPYIAMALIEGETLSAFVRARSQAVRDLAVRDKVLLAQRIAEAVGHAHDAGIVHRDLKPANVMVTPAGMPVVLDFGLARFLERLDNGESSLSHTGTLLGTLPYMSPEQVRGHVELDARSDVYALGVLMYELITGSKPYDLSGQSLVESARRIETLQPKRLSRQLHADLRAVLLKALEKRPAQRYASAGELASDLRRYLDGRPVSARAPSRRRTLARFFLRHWVALSFVFLMATIGLLLLLPGALPIPLTGNWWGQSSPFEGLRWNGDAPEVWHAGEWYALESIDGLRATYVVGYCQQLEPRLWRKRFSEDLVQVINRLGRLGFGKVDLTLRDLEDRHVFEVVDVEWSRAKRSWIYHDRNAWPWSSSERSTGALEIEWNGQVYEVLEIDGEPGARFGRHVDYDEYCEVVGRSPGETLDLVLRDVKTDERVVAQDVPRNPMALEEAGE